MATSLLSTTTAKVLASVVLVGGAASVAGLGTFGSFTSSTSASQSVSSGVVSLGLTQSGTAGTTVAATGVLPGDTIQRAVTLTRTGTTEAFGSIKVSTTAGTNNLLSSDATNGLQVAIDSCATAWTKNADNSLACAGTVTPVLAQRAVIGTNLDLAAAATQLNAAGAASNLRLTLSLPTGADNTFQGLSNAITFTFDATQKATATFR